MMRTRLLPGVHLTHGYSGLFTVQLAEVLAEFGIPNTAAHRNEIAGALIDALTDCAWNVTINLFDAEDDGEGGAT